MYEQVVSISVFFDIKIVDTELIFQGWAETDFTVSDHLFLKLKEGEIYIPVRIDNIVCLKRDWEYLNSGMRGEIHISMENIAPETCDKLRRYKDFFEMAIYRCS